MTAAACAVGVSLGLAGLVLSWRRSPSRRPRPTGRLAGCLGAALLAGLATGWPVAAVLAAAAVVGLPPLWGRTADQRGIALAEGVAGWTEQLRDTMAAAAGLSEALVATAGLAPVVLRPPLARLAARLRSGVPPADALRRLAAEGDDPNLDLVVAALVLATAAPAPRLTDLLDALADATRDDVAMRLRVEAGRASARSAVRTVVVFTVGFAVALVAVAHRYLAPFGSPGGQLVLAGVGACYAGGLGLMARMLRPGARPRLVSWEPR